MLFTGLQNDFNDVMKEIELGLHQVHASAKEKKIQNQDEKANEANNSKHWLVLTLVKSNLG